MTDHIETLRAIKILKAADAYLLDQEPPGFDQFKDDERAAFRMAIAALERERWRILAEEKPPEPAKYLIQTREAQDGYALDYWNGADFDLYNATHWHPIGPLPEDT